MLFRSHDQQACHQDAADQDGQGAADEVGEIVELSVRIFRAGDGREFRAGFGDVADDDGRRGDLGLIVKLA